MYDSNCHTYLCIPIHANGSYYTAYIVIMLVIMPVIQVFMRVIMPAMQFYASGYADHYESIYYSVFNMYPLCTTLYHILLFCITLYN